jgi:hypothetical protein
MQVFSYDYSTGAYTGPVTLDASDLDPRAPEVLLIPGNCTREPPPNCARGLWPFWRAGRWQVFEQIEIPDPFFTDLDN